MDLKIFKKIFLIILLLNFAYDIYKLGIHINSVQQYIEKLQSPFY